MKEIRHFYKKLMISAVASTALGIVVGTMGAFLSLSSVTVGALTGSLSGVIVVFILDKDF